MRSFKNFLVLGLMVLLIGLSFNCKNIFGPDFDNGDELKFATDVEIIYERTDISNEYGDGNVYLNIHGYPFVEGWDGMQNAEMEKISDQQFKYVVGTLPGLPADIRLYAYVYDRGKPSGENDHTARKIIVNGIELTDIRDCPVGNDFQVAYFTIKEDGTVVP